MSKELEKEIVTRASEGCCGGPASAGIDTCCVADADAKAAGDDGCGCGAGSAQSTKQGADSCC